jgi:long-chain-fatty-acid--CoA ligase ACSBG
MSSREYVWMPRELLGKQAREDGEFRHWISDISGELPIVIKSSGPASATPTTLLHHLTLNAQVAGDRPALREFIHNVWVPLSWTDVHKICLQVVRSLMHLQVTERACVSIIGANASEWTLAFLGSICANCVAVGVYPTSQKQSCAYLAKHSEMQVLFAQNEQQIQKYLEVLPQLPSFKAVVCYKPSNTFEVFRSGRSNFYTWAEFLALGKPQHDPILRTAHLSPGAVCSVVYTSGTTGPPKGVMLSQDNYIFLSSSILSLESYTADEHVVSYLPFSHTAGQIYDIVMPLLGRFCVSFADEKALSGTLLNTVRAVRPTFFFGVPRVYEKIEAEIRTLRRRHPTWEGPFGVQKIKTALGFERTKIFAVGAAPVQSSMISYLEEVGMLLFNVYGMTESCGPTTSTSSRKCNLFASGHALPGTDLRIVDSMNRPLPAGTRGEICFRGRNKFLGYFKSPKETRETIDSQGFIHSGDEGYLDEHGFLFITGRFKELIITAGGENIPPVLIEDQIKAETKLISNVMLVGDARKYLAALVTLRSVMRPDGLPSDQLTEEAIAVAQAEGSKVVTVSAALTCAKVRKLVDAAIVKANEKAATRAHYVRKWKFLSQDFSIAGGELTPTMKLKRPVVLSKYRSEIDALYSDPRL